MRSFLVQYMICAGFCAHEGNWPRFMYWISASLLTVSVLWGMK